MNFHEVRFPTDISFGSSGSIERRTEIVTLASGFEERNTPWARSRRRYDAGIGVRTVEDLEAILAFFEARKGQLYGFRWKDWLDHHSAASGTAISATDQQIGLGDGTTTEFQLTKTYGSGDTSYVRTISKPVDGTIHVAVGGVTLETGTDYTADPSSGRIELASAPGMGLAVTAGFEFDVPVRFDTAQIEYNIAAFDAGSIPSVPIIEVRV